MRRAAAHLTLRPADAAGDAVTSKLCADCPPWASIDCRRAWPREDIRTSRRRR